MMETIKKFLIFFLLSLAVLAAAFAAPPRVAVGDFTVTSDNPKLKYVGKGLAEMVAAELAASKGVILIDRDKREAALGEMEFSLSGMADAESQIEAGKLLSADYLLFGEIIDMDQAVLVSCKMIKVETGQVAWTDKNLGPLSDYDKISRKFAVSALKGLGAEKAAVAVAAPKVESKASAEKKVEAIVAFSGAVAALDKKDNAEAKRQIQVAAKIDTTNPAVSAYLAKLVANTTKFKVLLEPLYSYQNPAILGIIRTDTIHLATSMHPSPLMWAPLVEGLNYETYDGDKHITENVVGGHFGYSVPIGERLGLRADAIMGAFDDRGTYGAAPTNNSFGYGTSGGHSARGLLGAMLDVGYSLTPSFAVGGGVGYAAHDTHDSFPFVAFSSGDGGVMSATFGGLWRNADESLMVDSVIGYTSETSDVLNPLDMTNTGATSTMPFYLENTLTIARDQKRTMLILKQIDEIAYDRDLFFGTLMPAFERFITPGLSLRLGIEGSLLMAGSSPVFGYGAMGGATIRLMKLGMDLDLNASYRLRPSRLLQGELYPDLLILVNGNFNGVFKKSR